MRSRATDLAKVTVHERRVAQHSGTVAGSELGQARVDPRLLPDRLHPLGREELMTALVEPREAPADAEVKAGHLSYHVERQRGEGAERALLEREVTGRVSLSRCRPILTLTFLTLEALRTFLDLGEAV